MSKPLMDDELPCIIKVFLHRAGGNISEQRYQCFVGGVFSFALPVLALLPAAAVAAQFSFGVVPQQSASELAYLWTPMLSYLGEKISLKLEFRTAKDIPTFEQRLAAGEYDFAYMNPYHYVVFHDLAGYRALAKEKGQKLVGIIVVHKSSRYNEIVELNGAEVALPGPRAFGASILPLAVLKTRGILVKPRYVSSHESVYLSVAKGFFPAGGGIARTFENSEPSVREQLRVLWRTPGYTPHAIAAHPRVPKEIARTLQKALTTLDQEPRGSGLLRAIGFQGLVAARDKDYDDIRALDFRTLERILPK